MNKLLKIISVVTLLLFLRTSMALCADQVYFYYTDPAGTPLAMSDASGTVVWRADYMPFGEETINTQTVQNNKMFVGKEKDSESGLYYFGARYMDAGAGRFTSPDSIGPVNQSTGKINDNILLNPQRLNIYAYSLNNPYRFIDPDGLSPADRVAWAMSQLNSRDQWKGSVFSRYLSPSTGWRCSEFVAASLAFGDPDIASFPYNSEKITGSSKWFGRYSGIAPTVSDFANPNFMSSELAYLSISQAQAGDIVVWYGDGVHHSAIYAGEGKVIYQEKYTGVKENTLDAVTKNFRSKGFKGDPIVRRYVYPSE